MKRRLFIQSGSIALATTGLAACGGGGGGDTSEDAEFLTEAEMGRKRANAPAPAPTSPPAAADYPAWDYRQYYAAGAIVRYTPNGLLYVAKIENPGYDPTISTYYWAPYVAAAPSPAPSPAPAPADGLPAKILGCYFTAWDTTYPITDVPLDFNVIYLFHAVPAGPVENTNNNGDGHFKYVYGVTKDQVQACRLRGQKVILTVGGANNGFNFDTPTKSQNFVNSFREMYTALGGVDGCDFNNFEGDVGSKPAEMIWIAQQLRLSYGQNFAITAPPQPTSAVQISLLQEMSNKGALTYAAPQYYDWSGFNDDWFISKDIDKWVTLLGDARKVVVGMGGCYSNGPSLDVCTREWDRIKAAHPTIRGMFCWSAQTNLSAYPYPRNAWGSTMKARLA
jgi:hypothetical protein